MMKTKFLLMLLVAFGLVAGTAQANMLLNPSFEEGHGKTPDDWIHWYTSWQATHVWHDDPDGAHSGDKYMQVKMWGSGTEAWLMQTVNVIADQEYAFSVWAKNPPETQQKEAWAYYEWTEPNATNESGYRIISEGWLDFGWPSGDEWGPVDFGTRTAPAGASQLIFSLYGAPVNWLEGILFDDAAMYGPNPPTDANPRNQALKPPYGDDATGDEVVLSWMNMDPNLPEGEVYVDVWLGTDPNRPKDTKVVTAGENVTSVKVDAPPPSTPGYTTYYWQVDSYVNGSATGDPIEGPLWMFRSLSDLPVSATIGTPAMITWDNEPVDVNSTVIDDGYSPMAILWTAEPNNIVTFEPNEFVEDPTVTIAKGTRAEALIANPSFEDGLDGWDGRGGTWTGTYYAVKYITPTDGLYCAYTWSGTDTDAGLSQTLTETLAADTTYELTVDVVNDGYYAEDVQYKVQLLAGENVVAEDDDGHLLIAYDVWETSTVVHTSGGASDPNIGLPLEIRLVAKVGTLEMNFDNVELTASPEFPVQPGETYTLTVTVEDAVNVDTDTMTIDVYDDRCQAARIGLSLAEANLGDINADCDTDLVDLDALVATWLDEPAGLPTDAVIGSASTAGGKGILSTDFTNRTVIGPTASNINWSANGVSDPGDLTAVDIDSAAPAPFGLFDNANAANRFIPNLNILNEGPWSATITLNLTLPEITLEDAVLDYQHLGNSGVIPTVDKNGNLTVSVTGSVSGLLDSITIGHEVVADDGSGSDTFTFSSPLVLTDSESYDVTILAEGESTGANVGLDVLTLNGILDPMLPTADAGADWITFSGQAVDPNSSAVNNGTGDLTYAWSADPSAGVVFSHATVSPPETAIDPTVTITKNAPTGDVTSVILTLEVSNNEGSATDNMRIDVYDEACKMGLAIGMAVEYDPGDINQNCFTELKDFAAVGETWLDDNYQLTEPVEKP